MQFLRQICGVPESISYLLFVIVLQSACADEAAVSGDATIRAPYGGSEIVIKTTSRLAGAIDSLRWNGKEFIDSTDHGRQLQSATSFDAGSTFTVETFNPTEAGSVDDGAGAKSSSRLLHLIAKENYLQTTSQMAFWLSPTGNSGGKPAKNSTVLSDHLVTKRVRIGVGKLSNVLAYDVSFNLPVGEKHHYAQFEALTGYMPAEFSKFWKFNPESMALEPLDDGPGEQPFPVVLATESGSHAMGIIARDPTPRGMTGPGYGRFRFRHEKVVKWNCVCRLRDDQNGIPATDYLFRQYVIVGDLDSVTSSLTAIQRERSR
ncbi:MAG: hypothetical protein WCJ09_11930 [Planctomycetota bacterium]